MIDGKDIKDINLAKIRHSIGYVPQHVFLFSDTVANNIAFGVKDADIANIKAYAETLVSHDAIDVEQQKEFWNIINSEATTR